MVAVSLIMAISTFERKAWTCRWKPVGW